MTGQQEERGGGRREVREARLADKLRQNLARRKAKARALRNAGTSGSPADGPEALARGAGRNDNHEGES